MATLKIHKAIGEIIQSERKGERKIKTDTKYQYLPKVFLTNMYFPLQLIFDIDIEEKIQTDLIFLKPYL